MMHRLMSQIKINILEPPGATFFGNVWLFENMLVIVINRIVVHFHAAMSKKHVFKEI